MAFPCDRRCSFPKLSSTIDVREVFCRYSPNEMNNSTKTGKYRCTGAHSTKNCAVGVVEAIHVGVSNTINNIEKSLQWTVNTFCYGNMDFSNERNIARHYIHLRIITFSRRNGFSSKKFLNNFSFSINRIRSKTYCLRNVSWAVVTVRFILQDILSSGWNNLSKIHPSLDHLIPPPAAHRNANNACVIMGSSTSSVED